MTMPNVNTGRAKVTARK